MWQERGRPGIVIFALVLIWVNCAACSSLQENFAPFSSPTPSPSSMPSLSPTPMPSTPASPSPTSNTLFDLGPITTSNVLTIIQIFVVFFGFLFSYQSLKAARNSVDVAAINARAQLVNQLVLQGRDLQYKFIQTFHRGTEAQEVEQSKSAFRGMIIAYFSSGFELRRILDLSGDVAQLLDGELKQVLRDPAMYQKWTEIEELYSDAFREHVKGLINGEESQ